MRTTVFFLSVYCCFLSAQAQKSRVPVHSTYTRLGAYSQTHTDVFSFTANQAALANSTSATAGVYGERRFLLQELAFYQAAVALPVASGTFGFTSTYFGNMAYNEAGASLAYGRKLGEKVSVGAQFNYYSFRVTGYGHATAVNAEAGFLFHITEQLHAGLHVYNPTGSGWTRGNEKIPAVYSAGLGFDASDKFTFYTEIQQIARAGIYVNTGLQYKANEWLRARGGFTSASSMYYLGLGVRWQNIRLDATTSMHPQLGLTPGLLLIFEPEKKAP